MSAVGDFMMKRWEDLKINQADFARLVKENSGYVQQVKDGNKTLADDKIEVWSDALKLNSSQSDRFSDLVALSHLPQKSQPRFLKMLDEIVALRSVVQRLERR